MHAVYDPTMLRGRYCKDTRISVDMRMTKELNTRIRGKLCAANVDALDEFTTSRIRGPRVTCHVIDGAVKGHRWPE